MSIPLVNSNSVNDINTSLIAVRKEINSSTGATDVNINVNYPENAIPVDEVTSGNMHSVTSNAVSKAMSYSTTEKNTGKKWIDGKDIYRKIFYSDTGYIDGSQVGVISDADMFVSKKIIILDNNNNILIDYVNSAVSQSVGIYINNSTKIITFTISNLVATKAWVTLEYTKS